MDVPPEMRKVALVYGLGGQTSTANLQKRDKP
jgi:hypothetical protein